MADKTIRVNSEKINNYKYSELLKELTRGTWPGNIEVSSLRDDRPATHENGSKICMPAILLATKSCRHNVASLEVP